MQYKDITDEYKEKKQYKISEQNYFIDNNGVRHDVDGKNVKIKATKKERKVAETIGEIYGGEVKIIPVVLNPKGIKTPDYIINNEKFDLKEPTGGADTTIYDLLKHKNKQANNFIIDIHRSQLKQEDSIKQVERLFYSKHRKWIKTIILMDNNEIFKILKRVN